MSKKRDSAQLKEEVNHMREKMRNHLDKSADDLIDIKQGTGGLVDIEFLAQYLVLAHSSEYENLTERCDNLGVFKSLAKLEIISVDEQKLLANNYQQLRDYGHKATLQNEALLINKSLLTEHEKVIELWKKFV